MIKKLVYLINNISNRPTPTQAMRPKTIKKFKNPWKHNYWRPQQFFQKIKFFPRKTIQTKIQFICSNEIMIMMINCFCEMVDQQKVFSLISTQDHWQTFSEPHAFDTPQVGLEPTQNLRSSFAE